MLVSNTLKADAWDQNEPRDRLRTGHVGILNFSSRKAILSCLGATYMDII